MSSTWVASRPATEPTCQKRKLSRAPRSVTSTAPMRLCASAMTAAPARAIDTGALARGAMRVSDCTSTATTMVPTSAATT